MSWAEQAAAVLENEHVVLRPVQEADRDGLHEIAMAPAIWRYFVTRVDTDADFDTLFHGMLTDQASGARRVFVIVDKNSGRIAGSMSYGNRSEKDLRLEIGWSWLGVDFQGIGVNRQAKLLLLQHAFETLQAERVEFKTDVLNLQARRGLVNIGGVEEGIFRSFNPMPDGRRRDAIYFSVIRSEWAAVKQHLSTASRMPAATRATSCAGSAWWPPRS